MARAEEHSLEDPSSDVECYEEEDDRHLLTEADGPSEETQVSKVRVKFEGSAVWILNSRLGVLHRHRVSVFEVEF